MKLRVFPWTIGQDERGKLGALQRQIQGRHLRSGMTGDSGAETAMNVYIYALGVPILRVGPAINDSDLREECREEYWMMRDVEELS